MLRLRKSGVHLVCPISSYGMQRETLLLLLNSCSYFVCLALCLTFMWEEQMDIVCECHPRIWIINMYGICYTDIVI